MSKRNKPGWIAAYRSDWRDLTFAIAGTLIGVLCLAGAVLRLNHSDRAWGVGLCLLGLIASYFPFKLAFQKLTGS